MTQCIQTSFAFPNLGSREVVAQFDGGDITSDAGGLLLWKTEQKTGILRQFAACFRDLRDPRRIEHTVREMVAQRVNGLALGYEDLNDHDDLRADPLMAMLCGKADVKGEKREKTRDRGKALAGKSTLNRLELTPEDATAAARYKKIVLSTQAVDELMVELFIQAHRSAPEEIILDLDATDDRIHGHQEGRFFHGYYGGYCYLPLYIFCGEFLLCSRLRTAGEDASAGTEEELERIVGRIRRVWPQVRIIVRADSGFCRDSILSWCEANQVQYAIGLAKNARLKAEVAVEQAEAAVKYAETQKAARVFKDFRYQTKETWSCERRVVGKAEHMDRGENPRFVVTSITVEKMDGRGLYEELYCGRGEMENRIKEQQLDLYADRTSTSKMLSNQIRLYFSSIAYILMQALRRLGLVGTEMEKAQCGTIRLRLLKVGAQIRVTVRRIWVSMAGGHPKARVFEQVMKNLEGCMAANA